jgi:hypothetical protein
MSDLKRKYEALSELDRRLACKAARVAARQAAGDDGRGIGIRVGGGETLDVELSACNRALVCKFSLLETRDDLIIEAYPYTDRKGFEAMACHVILMACDAFAAKVNELTKPKPPAEVEVNGVRYVRPGNGVKGRVVAYEATRDADGRPTASLEFRVFDHADFVSEFTGRPLHAINFRLVEDKG